MIGSAKLARLGLVLAAAALISGCATSGNPKDPFEGYNRVMFDFNETVDRIALKPAATVYQETLPQFVQTGVGNFFGNISDVWTAINNLLQGDLESGMSDVGRVTINTMLGIFGLIDVATDAGLPKHQEDFGQTLGKWGVKSGPYLVLPFLGPSTVRDTAALPVDITGDPVSYFDPGSIRNFALVTRIVDQRASALSASELLEEAALDKYDFVRDAYLQRRAYLIKNNKKSKEEKAQRDSGEDGWITVNGPDKLSGSEEVDKQETPPAPSGDAKKEAPPPPSDASSRGSAARAIYTYGVRPR